ncbi:MAG TPA: hypothetical protein DCQ37_24890 [Desulfobacteraceae bacterium]|nr:hypothetical protein [Desulfobacteraceae bacterium]
MKNGCLWICSLFAAIVLIWMIVEWQFLLFCFIAVLTVYFVAWIIKSCVSGYLEMFKRNFESPVFKETAIEKRLENQILKNSATFSSFNEHSGSLRENMTLKDKIKNLINYNQDVIRNYGIMRLGLFASVIREEEKENSDIDLIAEFKPGMKNYDNFINLCFFLQDNLGKEVNLLTLEGISPIIRKNIEREIEYIEIVS